MRLQCRYAFGALVLSAVVPRTAGAQVIVGFEPREAVRGRMVRVTGTALPADRKKVWVSLLGGDGAQYQIGNPNTATDTALTFEVPGVPVVREPPGAKQGDARNQTQILSAGAYHLFISSGDSQAAATAIPMGDLGLTPFKIVPDTEGAVKLLGVAPPLVYAEGNSYQLTLLTENLSASEGDVHLRFDRLGDVALCWSGAKDCSSGIQATRDGNTLVISHLPATRYGGATRIAVGSGDAWSEYQPVTLASHSKSALAVWSAAAVFVMWALVLLLFQAGSKEHRISQETYGFLRGLLLDRETDTYSLSRLQFYLWTTVTIFAYVYWVMVRGWMQNVFTPLPDLPASLPGMLLASVGTATVAVGISNSHGPKGAGEIFPSWSDFISTGGVVAPERLQFLLWTVVAVGGFLYSVLFADPLTLKDLPAIPAGLIALTGISSAGYLGGKLLRKPGPVINDPIEVAPGTTGSGSLCLGLKGRALSKDATVQLEGGGLTGPTPATTVTAVASDDQAGDGFCKEIKVHIAAPSPPLATGRDITLTLTNPDGQKAVWEFKSP